MEEEDILELISLVDELTQLAGRPHYYCEDSCPKSTEGCANDAIDKDTCSCGADAHNERVDEINRRIFRLLK